LGSFFFGGPFAGDPQQAGQVPGSPGAPSAGFMPSLSRPGSSFTDFLASYSPDLLPGRIVRGGPSDSVPAVPDPVNPVVKSLPHATTIVAAVCHQGVVLAGDRRATMGNMIAKRDIEKVFRSDDFSAIGYAGTGSLGMEFVRLFQVELEHYEKMEGRSLSLEGKANRLATMVRGNLGAAMQGFVVVPLFVGFDEDAGTGHIFSYDVAGGPYEEQRFYSIGSGSIFARGALKKLYVDDMPVTDTVLACVQALYDAADDDSATGGPDLPRRIFPAVATVTGDGFRMLPEAEAADYAEQVVRERMRTPDGPLAPLRDS
jgi:proteasome beta subunit